jgi:murein L,D-transpeptidase YcbB/YkuD
MTAQITLSGKAPGCVSTYSRPCLTRNAFAWLTVLSILVTAIPVSGNAADLPGEAPAAIQAAVSQYPLELQEFYARRQNAPVWLGPKRLMELQQLEKLPELHGLNPEEYSLLTMVDRIRQLQTDPDGVDLATFDVSVSAAIIKLAVHLRDGSVDLTNRRVAIPRTGNEIWAATDELLTGAAESESLFSYLNALTPDTVIYRALQSGLSEYRRMLAQGTAWVHVSSGQMLEPGMHEPRVALLRERLGQTSPDMSEIERNFYDPDLAAAVADFQARHLLTSDSLVGGQTVAALNVPVAKRIDQILVNLEWQRWAAMPEHQEYLLVNVAQFAIHLVEDGDRTWSARTQVGRYNRQTPVFKSELTKVVANPTWTVPPTIFREDVLPKVQADPAYLERQQMRVIDAAGQTVDTSNFDWQAATAGDFPYRLRAKAGKSNALGQIKFEIPNPYLIYLHDTPSRKLFDNDVRAFSSGCIRLENPGELAHLLMERQVARTANRIDKAMAGQRTRHIELDKPMPIVIMYGTVDVNKSGDLVFARDVYRRDRVVLAAINTAQPDDRDTIMLARVELPAQAL